MRTQLFDFSSQAQLLGYTYLETLCTDISDVRNTLKHTISQDCLLNLGMLATYPDLTQPATDA